MLKQLNIFVDNKPGRLHAITKLISENNINIRAFTIQDREDYGLMKIIVDKPDQAHLIISEKGFACALKEILAVHIEDKPGGLEKLLKILDESKINIKDAYGFVIGSDNFAILCIEVDDTNSLKKLVLKHNFMPFEEKDLSKL